MPVWSQFVLDVAEVAEEDPQQEHAESRFYPAFMEMLREAFARHNLQEPLRFMRYSYTPKYHGAGEREIDVVTVVFLVAPNRWVPILLEEGKPPEHIQWPSTLLAADRQLRNRFPDIHKLKLMPIPGINHHGEVRPEFLLTRLYGISSIGWLIRSYTYDMEEKRVIDPPYTKPPPADRWAIDARTEEGCNEIDRIVTLVVEQCRAVGIFD